MDSSNQSMTSFPRQNNIDDYWDHGGTGGGGSGGGIPNRQYSQSQQQQQENQIPFNTNNINISSLNIIWNYVNKELFISKVFYFFFFSAFGSLFPLMAVYFKQLGMNAIQAGTLIGIRPFIEFVSAPFWSSLADRYHKSKLFLIFALISWIVFTYSLAFIRPPASACVIFNETHHILFTPYSDYNTNTPVPDIADNSNIDNKLYRRLVKRDTNDVNVDVVDDDDDGKDEMEKEWIRKWGAKHKPPPTHIVGKSPLTVEYTLNYNQEKHVSYVSPPFSTIVYKLDDVKEVFFLLLLLILLGEFFSAPAITLADSATLAYLGDNTDSYGQQRMFGSFGWGITMFFVGMALDNSTRFTDHPCGAHIGERNYVTCFTIFALLMALALVASSQFRFDYDNNYQSQSIIAGTDEIQLKAYDYDSSGPKPWLNQAPPINKPPELLARDKKFEFIDNWKSAVFAQRTRQMPQWVKVLRSLANMRQIAFLFVTWFMGFGIGLVFTFLFWHLQDLGGTPTLFGMASVINHISEICAYFYSYSLITTYGHTKVLCIGLIGNVVRFLYISWLDNPFWVLPFELIQGVTHATVWAAACSYVTQHTDPELRSSTQGVLQGLHHGLGRGCGSIIGGIFVNRWGTRVTFRLYGVSSIIVLAGFIHFNYYKPTEGYNFYEDNDNDNVIIDTSGALAPHGVPTNPIGRSHSRQNIQQQQQSPGTKNPVDNNNAMIVNNNPFQLGGDSYLDPNNVWATNQQGTDIKLN
ncbi:major facilitator superfamily domain-containing protein 6-like [Oppia nitens]|uniref:major facilitator superfamily domain-containing protein 6-like n=1 Tax=Oppia nitens TaxID=1686743 RepID=UPI0023D9DF04|nr:major facilitator superfamily domain-containing protein 6-like [Oppia nitens]